ncbi:GTPaseactivator protein for Ras-like GTPase [Balamuthia mandrillaris]
MAKSSLNHDKRHEIWKQRLLDPEFQLLSTVYRHRLGKEAEELATHLFRFFRAHRKDKQLMVWVTKEEVRTSTSAGVIFREQGVLTKLLNMNCFNEEGRKFLRQTVVPLVEDLIREGQSLEIDPQKAGPEEDVKKNEETLLSKSRVFLKTLYVSVHLLPENLGVVMKELQEAVGKRFPELRATIVPSILFLRFICPALVSPQRFGLVPEQPNGRVARALILISKLLTNVANGVILGSGKESFTSCFDPFVRQNQDDIRAFAQAIVRKAEESQSKRSAASFSSSSSLASVQANNNEKEKDKKEDEVEDEVDEETKREQEEALTALLDYLASCVDRSDASDDLLPDDLTLSVRSCSEQLRKMQEASKDNNWKLLKKRKKSGVCCYIRKKASPESSSDHHPDEIFVKATGTVPTSLKALHNFLLLNNSRPTTNNEQHDANDSSSPFSSPHKARSSPSLHITTDEKEETKEFYFPLVPIQEFEPLDAYRRDYRLALSLPVVPSSSTMKARDFCTTRYSFVDQQQQQQEQSKAYCCFFSTYRKDCPRSLEHYVRGQLFPSGHIIEEMKKDETKECTLTYLLHIKTLHLQQHNKNEQPPQPQESNNIDSLRDLLAMECGKMLEAVVFYWRGKRDVSRKRSINFVFHPMKSNNKTQSSSSSSSSSNTKETASTSTTNEKKEAKVTILTTTTETQDKPNRRQRSSSGSTLLPTPAFVQARRPSSPSSYSSSSSPTSSSSFLSSEAVTRKGIVAVGKIRRSKARKGEIQDALEKESWKVGSLKEEQEEGEGIEEGEESDSSSSANENEEEKGKEDEEEESRKKRAKEWRIGGEFRHYHSPKHLQHVVRPGHSASLPTERRSKTLEEERDEAEKERKYRTKKKLTRSRSFDNLTNYFEETTSGEAGEMSEGEMERLKLSGIGSKNVYRGGVMVVATPRRDRTTVASLITAFEQHSHQDRKKAVL